jgi:hypothetical protein
MRTEEMPWWLHLTEIIGFEEEEDDSEEDDEDESEEEDEEIESDDEDEDEDDEGEDDDEDDEKPDVSGLKSALRKERMARKRAERELKKLKSKAKGEKPKSKEEDESEKSSAELEAEREKNQRLANRLRDQAIDRLILKHASKFADPDDAVRLINRADIEYDQDEDDPSEIEVDEESVIDAVKTLAKKKKHLLATNAGRSSKSGSKFNGKKNSKKEPSDEELRRKYSALRR